MTKESDVDMERDFKKKIREALRLERESADRYRVFTPFMFADGDHPVIVLKRGEDGWTLSDEGNTLMRLSFDCEREPTDDWIAETVARFDVEDRDGALTLPVRREEIGSALFAFAQAILKIAD